MKQIINTLLVIAFMAIYSSTAYGQATSPISINQYYSVGNPVATWSIDINEKANVSLTYTTNLYNFEGAQVLVFYEINTDGTENYIGSASGYTSGTCYTTTKTGKAKVMLYTMVGGNAQFEVQFNADYSMITNNDLRVGGSTIIEGDATVNGNTTLAGPVSTGTLNAGDIFTTGVHAGSLDVNGNARVNRTITTNEIHFIGTSNGDDNTDPYTLRKVHDWYDKSHLDLNLNDNEDESFRIYGNSCNGYGCGTYSGNLYHSFDASGNAYHAGKLSIGTTAADPTGAKLTVNGTIHAKEVIVDNNILPDYVFDNTYKLMPLNQVEQYVKTNKHLPEIQSATEVKDKGMSMGEMQNKMLQKIEELTLYAIELQKTVNAQSSQISVQNAKIEELEKKIK